MELPLVSVVVPIYNVEAYLDRCVESIVNQTYENLEIILVDDGSPDGCPAMCDAWKLRDDRIQVIHKSNAGLGMARNSGIDAATGKYIFFIDSDDYIESCLVSRCVDSAERYKSDAVVFGRRDVHEDGTQKNVPMISPKDTYENEEIINDLLPAMFTYDYGFGVSAWGKMYRLGAFRENCIYFVSEREIIYEDAYFALEFYSVVSCVSVVNENLYFYCVRNSSLSRVYKEDRQLQNDLFGQKSLEFIEERMLPEKIKKHVMARYHMYTMSSMKQVCRADDDRLRSVGGSCARHNQRSYCGTTHYGHYGASC